jgi:mono/diheme cytochrome c family protein
MRTLVVLSAAKDLLARRARALAMLAGPILVMAKPTSAQSTDTAAASSTRAGVYTTAQAERGKITYAGMCRSCHSPASHTGATFEKLWKGRTVAALFAYTSTQMPKSDPGGLNPNEYADVVAYLLKMNGMPVGARELAADSASLATVVIEMPPKPAKRVAPPKARSTPPTKPRGKPPTRTQED